VLSRTNLEEGETEILGTGGSSIDDEASQSGPRSMETTRPYMVREGDCEEGCSGLQVRTTAICM
jgi:hypothetical protein